jgi:hypothetical protein
MARILEHDVMPCDFCGVLVAAISQRCELFVSPISIALGHGVVTSLILFGACPGSKTQNLPAQRGLFLWWRPSSFPDLLPMIQDRSRRLTRIGEPAHANL